MLFLSPSDGVWNMPEPTILDLGYHAVTSLLIMNNDVWAASGENVNVISVTSHYHGHEVVFNIRKVLHCCFFFIIYIWTKIIF